MLKLQAIGHIGQDATIKDVNGKKVTNFSVAHTDKYKDKNGVATEKTTWVDCALWDSENVTQYLKKGTLVYVEGRPESESYTTKEGEVKDKIKLSVSRLELLSAGKN